MFTFFFGWMLNCQFVGKGFQTDDVYHAEEFMSGQEASNTELKGLNRLDIVHKYPELLMEDQTDL